VGSTTKNAPSGRFPNSYLIVVWCNAKGECGGLGCHRGCAGGREGDGDH